MKDDEHITDGTPCPCGTKEIPIKQEDGSIDWIQIHNRENDE